MNCPNPDHRGLDWPLPVAGIGWLLGPCRGCGMYYDPTEGVLVNPIDKYNYNPGHNEDPEEWDEQELKDLYTGVW